MSIANRKKVGYYTLQFKVDNDYVFNKSEFDNFLTFLSGLDDKEYIINIESANKTISIEKIEEIKYKEMTIYDIVFNSCKYNHSPDYMSSITGSKRPSDKDIDEGDTETTHAAFFLGNDECTVVMEERRQGCSIGNIKMLLQYKIEQFSDKNKYNLDGKLQYTIIQSKDFIELLEGSKRVISMDVVADYSMFGTAIINSSNISDSQIQKDATLTIKSERGKNIVKSTVKSIFNKISGTQVNRIRVRAKDTNDNDILLDSLNLKMKQYVDVQVNEKGVVTYNSIVPQLNQLLHGYLEDAKQI